MNTIKTIDLWTEPNANNIECFSGAFIDVLKVVKNHLIHTKS